MKRFLLFSISFLLIFASVDAQSVDKHQLKVLTGDKEGTYYQMMNDINFIADSIILVDSIMGYHFKIQLDTIMDTIPMTKPHPNSDPKMTNKGPGELVPRRNPETGELVIHKNVLDSVEKFYDTIPFINILPSGGDFINYQKLVSNDYRYADIFFIQHDVLMQQELQHLQGNVNVSGNVRILLPVGFAEVHLITRKDAEIDSIGALEKKRVGVGIQGTGVTAEIIKNRLGIKWKNVYVGLGSALGDLLNDRIDAFFYVGMAPVYKFQNTSPLLKDLIKLVPLQSDTLDQIYEPTIIKGGTYEWQEDDIETYKVPILLATNIEKESASDYLRIQKFLDLILDNKEELSKFNWEREYQFHPKWTEVDPKLDVNRTRRTIKFPGVEWKVHKAAIKRLMKK